MLWNNSRFVKSWHHINSSFIKQNLDILPCKGCKMTSIANEEQLTSESTRHKHVSKFTSEYYCKCQSRTKWQQNPDSHFSFLWADWLFHLRSLHPQV